MTPPPCWVEPSALLVSTYFQAIQGEDQDFLTIEGRQSKTPIRFLMDGRSMLSIWEETKTEIRRSLPRKNALDGGE
jgi:hypothetical protein